MIIFSLAGIVSTAIGAISFNCPDAQEIKSEIMSNQYNQTWVKWSAAVSTDNKQVTILFFGRSPSVQGNLTPQVSLGNLQEVVLNGEAVICKYENGSLSNNGDMTRKTRFTQLSNSQCSVDQQICDPSKNNCQIQICNSSF